MGDDWKTRIRSLKKNCVTGEYTILLDMLENKIIDFGDNENPFTIQEDCI